ncbi:MlaD family protein [Alcaligenaceae bacterium B3P038]|nr:MlaD family protein [Alcaligenaceae bacterium B3P038]
MRRPSAVWLVPVLAALATAMFLAWSAFSFGAKVVVTFDDATGLVAGKTTVRYRGVVIGHVSAIALSESRTDVRVDIAPSSHARDLARSDTRFWVVKPHIGPGEVSGLEAMMTGAYIAVDFGHSTTSSQRSVGLASPPAVVNDAAGTFYTLRSAYAGTAASGSPIMHRGVRVGRVVASTLDADGRHVAIGIFIDAPNDRYVTADTRFWRLNGVSLSMGSEGLKVDTEALSTLMTGGLAFDTPRREIAAAAPAKTQFALAENAESAMALVDGPAYYLELRFDQTLRGLTVDAPVDFNGVSVGKVTSIAMDFEASRFYFSSIVGITVYPHRMGRVFERLPQPDGDQRAMERFLEEMVRHGLRAQARPSNVLFGPMYISLEFKPDTPAVAFDATARPLILPTYDGSMDQMQDQAVKIMNKIAALPLDEAGEQLAKTLGGVKQVLYQLDTKVLPASTAELQSGKEALAAIARTFNDDAPAMRRLEAGLGEVQRTSRALRWLMESLERNPESLLWGSATPSPASGR